MRRSADVLGPLVTRLAAIGPLTESDIDLILALPYTARDGKAGWEIVREGDTPSQCCLILDGTFGRFKVAAEGARQIVSYHIRGDLPDLQSCFLAAMDHTLCALTPGTVAFIPHAAIRNILEEKPALGAKLLRESFIDSSVSREWLCNVGRRQAESRIAHLICEMFTRHQAAGSADQFTFPFGLTQTAISDAQGMSTVHVNRVLQKLKADNLISSHAQSRTITILDWDGLQEVGDFDPGYLHILN
jgi:CRP-like cAMP-binding protein